jgi:hypothetical protein
VSSSYYEVSRVERESDDGEERKDGQGERMGGGGGGVASLGSPGILLGLQSEQEVAREAQRASTQLLDWLKVEDKGRFAKRLSRFGVF